MIPVYSNEVPCCLETQIDLIELNSINVVLFHINCFDAPGIFMQELTHLPKTAFSFLFYFVRKQKFKFFLLFFCSLIWATNDAFFPFFLKHIVNTLQHFQGKP